MERLPVELLAHLVTFLDKVHEEERVTKTTHDLAILSRVNKVFNEIVTPLLYLEPRLWSKTSAELWAKTYSLKANPWTVMRGLEPLKYIVVPRKVTLAPVCERDEDGSIELPDEDTDAVSLFRFNTVFTPFFFRNLTSFIAHEPLVDSNFVSALFGPKGSNRSTIIDLSLNLYLRSQNLVLFLLESYRYFRWEWEDPSDWIDVVDDRKYADYVTERLMSVEGMPDEEMNRIVSKVVELAAIKFSIFDLHCLSEAESFDFLPDVLNFKYTISTTPFTNLVKLKFTVFSNAEIALIFLTPLFPHLRHLTLDGYMYMTPHFEEDLKMLRYSITQRRGSIRPPYLDINQDDPAFVTLLTDRNWDPLTDKEMKDYCWKPYRGPNLDLLDLSSCILLQSHMD